MIILLGKQISVSYDHIMYSKMTAHRKKHSCDTALIGLVEDWRLALDNKQKARLLSMDISKAFDSVLPSLTVAKLGAYGFNDKSLQLLRSNFKGRLNRVKVGKATSDWNVMKRGCRQGSSFSLTLRNLYQNDLSYHINEIANLNMYADDHQMYIVGSDISIMCTNMEKEGNSALKWCKDNYLLSNPEKLNAIGIKQRNETEQINIKIGDEAIKTTDNIKLLGVNFDENLTFSQHISELCKKVSQRVGVLARLRNLITTETKLLLYKTAIMPYLTCCHLAWHFCKASDTRKVERIQEQALRIVYNSHSETYMNLLDRAKLPSLLNRRLQDIVILMYKVKYRLVPDFICDIFSTKSCKYDFRNQILIFLDLILYCMVNTLLDILDPFYGTS